LLYLGIIYVGSQLGDRAVAMRKHGLIGLIAKWKWISVESVGTIRIFGCYLHVMLYHIMKHEKVWFTSNH
jgi:hypothetical protein